MSMVVVELDGQEFRWYDNGGAIYTGRGDDVTLVGRFHADESLWNFPEDEREDENRRRAEDHERGRVRSIAIAWLRQRKEGDAQ